MPAEWFPRLRAVPGVEYEPALAIDRASLDGHDETPQVKTFDTDDGTRHSYLTWGEDIETPLGPPDDPYAEVEYTSRLSPARRRAGPLLPDDDIRTDTVLQATWEALELPGATEDYYRILEATIGTLQRNCLDEPYGLDSMEKLAWLELRLLVSQPQLVIHDEYVWPARGVEALIRLYEDEGFVADAMKVADLAGAFRTGGSERELLRGRIDALRSEQAA